MFVIANYFAFRLDRRGETPCPWLAVVPRLRDDGDCKPTQTNQSTNTSQDRGRVDRAVLCSMLISAAEPLTRTITRRSGPLHRAFDYDHEHEHERSIRASAFLRHSAFELRHFAFSVLCSLSSVFYFLLSTSLRRRTFASYESAKVFGRSFCRCC